VPLFWLEVGRKSGGGAYPDGVFLSGASLLGDVDAGDLVLLDVVNFGGGPELEEQLVVGLDVDGLEAGSDLVDLHEPRVGVPQGEGLDIRYDRLDCR
jgi:hypothetical protein